MRWAVPLKALIVVRLGTFAPADVGVLPALGRQDRWVVWFWPRGTAGPVRRLFRRHDHHYRRRRLGRVTPDRYPLGMHEWVMLSQCEPAGHAALG